jgi:hypothetical protein
MNASMLAKLEQLTERHQEVGALLADPEIIGDNDRFRALSMEYAQLEPVASGFLAYRRTLDDLDSAREMSRDSDPELRAMAQEELLEAEERRVGQERALQLLLLPRDPHDAGNVFLEIRAGTGGDEAALFAGDLLRMYARYAELRGWTLEILSESLGEHGGYKEIDQPSHRSWRLFAAEVRIRRASGAAGAGHRGAGPHSHLRRDCGGAAGTGGGGAGRHQPQTSYASTPTVRLRGGRSARQQDRFGDPHHPFAQWNGRGMSG